jgi:hypothetical protein
MRDPISWSFPIGKVYGITVRIHVLFPFIVITLLLRIFFMKEPAPAGTITDAAILMGLLFVAVLAHELGHCAGARYVEGDAQEILLWPLGGLAALDLPHRARAHFIAVAAGPAVNLLIAFLTGLVLLWVTDFSLRPPFNPLWSPLRPDASTLAKLYTWRGEEHAIDAWGTALLARVFWLNWVLFLVNVVVVGFPLDGGRLLQAALWPRFGFHQATMYAVFVGFATFVVVAGAAIIANEMFFALLAVLIYLACRQQYILLETGGEEALFGYDFSQGYSSLEGQAPAPRKRQPNILQRWRQKRNARKLQRELEQRESEERRMDQLLEKVQRDGLSALTEEERRFLKRVSDRYRNRQ